MNMKEEILRWASDVATLLDACEQLVEYYGTHQELSSFRSGVEAPLWLIEAMKEIASGRQSDTTKVPPFSKFLCNDELATILTPLLRIVVEWQPDFILMAFETSDDVARKQITVPYGQFIGTVAMYLCDPMWTKRPHLAPQGWST